VSFAAVADVFITVHVWLVTRRISVSAKKSPVIFCERQLLHVYNSTMKEFTLRGIKIPPSHFFFFRPSTRNFIRCYV